MNDRELLQVSRPLARLPESQWACRLLSTFPLGEAQLRYDHIVQWLQIPQSSEVFLQVWKLGESPAGAAYGGNIQRWLPVNGIGLVPGGRPPQRLTEAIAMDIAAAGLAGEEPPLSSHPVVHVSGGADAASHAVTTLFGTGLVLQMWFPSAAHINWARQTKAVYQPTVTDPLFQRERFYLPLLTPAIAEQASDDDLDRWLCGATAYLRETPGEKGVLVLRRNQL